MSTTTATTPYVVDDCRGVLQVYSDGSITRSTEPPGFGVPVSEDGSVLWKDVLFSSDHNLHLRLYKPTTTTTTKKLPIFYYIHGGGFCIGSRAWPNCQNYCFRLASDLQVVVVSPDYRLAPEHRLPAAIDDSFMAVKWLQQQAVSEDADTWLTDVADFERVFISGDSAGGNVAHHLMVGLGAGSPELKPIRVRGYVLLGPFFGGTVRTRCEADPWDAFLNMELIDRFWRLSIPIGDNTDHPLVNPFGPRSSIRVQDKALDPILVVMGGSDLLKERAKDYAEKLKSWGKKIEYVEYEGQQHGFFTLSPNCEAANMLMQVIKRFISENS